MLTNLRERMSKRKKAAKCDETLRELYLLAVSPNLSFSEKVDTLLRLGRGALGASMGIVSRINDGKYEVLFSSGPDWAPAPGTRFDLNGTYCVHTLLADEVKHFHAAGTSEIATHPCYLEFGLESYIGVPIKIGGQTFGTVNFSSPEARRPFRREEIEMIRFIGFWFASEWQKQQEHDQLFRQSTILKAALQSVPDPVVTLDAERRIQSANPAAERTFGYAASELIGRQVSALYHDMGDYEDRTQTYTEARHEKIDGVDLHYRRKSGESFVGKTTAEPLFSEQGDFLGYLGVVQEKPAAGAAEQRRSQLFATVSHELRAPVASILSSLKLLEMKGAGDPEKTAKWLIAATANARRLQTLIDDILDVESLSQTKPNTQARAINLNGLLDQAATGMRDFAEEHAVNLKLCHSPELACVMGDSGRIVQVLTNLISNAIKASPAQGVVSLGLTKELDGFWVRDRGKGIPEEFQPYLFDRFTRAAESYDSVRSGSGLGMSIVKSIVDHHMGSLSFDSKPGKGTVFTVRLPQSEAGTVLDAEPAVLKRALSA